MGTCFIFYKVYYTTYIVLTLSLVTLTVNMTLYMLYMSNYQERYVDYLVRNFCSFHNRTMQLLCFSVIDINLLTMLMNI